MKLKTAETDTSVIELSLRLAMDITIDQTSNMGGHKAAQYPVCAPIAYVRLQAVAHRMAFCIRRGIEFVILFAFTVSTFSALIHCRSLLHLSETPTTNDEGDIMLSDMSDQERSQQFADFDDPIDDDTISDETSDEGNETLSDEQLADFDDTISDETSDEGNETLSDEQLADFDNPIDDAISDETSDEGDETLSDEQLADFDNPIDNDAISDETSDEGDETLADFDDAVSDLLRSAIETSSDEGDKTLSDMSDQEEFDEQLADFDYPVDDDDVSYRPRSAVETSDEGDKTLSMSDQEGFNEQLADFDFPIQSEPEWSLLQSLQGSEVTQEQFGNSSEGGWAAMSPKLRCGDDLMNLQLFGSGVDQVELCRGSSAPVPLGHLPPDCGHTSPTHGGLVYATPYDGCGVAQQGGNYFMRMLWHGNPMVLSCPMT